MRTAIMVTTSPTCQIVETIEDDEFAGDEFALVEDERCIDPLGHLFKTSCGGTACIHCGTVKWS